MTAVVIFWDINIQVPNIYIADYFLGKDIYACLDYQLHQLLWQMIHFLLITGLAASSKCLRIYCQYYILLALDFKENVYSMHFIVCDKQVAIPYD